MTALTCKICERTLEVPTGAREVQRRQGLVTYIFPNREVHIFRVVKDKITTPPVRVVEVPIAPIAPVQPKPVKIELEQPKPEVKPQHDKFDKFGKFGATLAHAFRNSNFKK